jgi:hypothetical protein
MPLLSTGRRCRQCGFRIRRHHLKRGLCGFCRKHPDFEGPAPLPDRPTRHAPATRGKVEDLAQRARQHRELFHPDDARQP